MAKTNNTGQRVGQGLARYRALLVSMTLFVLFVIALLIGSFLASNYMSQQARIMNQLQQLDTVSALLTKNMYALKTGQTDTPFTPLNKTAIDNGMQQQKYVNEFLTNYRNGGVVHYGNAAVDVPAIANDEVVSKIQAFESAWKNVSQDLTPYFASAKKISAEGDTLSAAFNSVQGNDYTLRTNAQAAVAATQANFNRTAQLIQTAQVIGFIGAILFLILFIFLFVRRLIAADKEAEAAREEVNEIMATVDSGLFLVDNNLQIGSQYSNRLQGLIGQEQIGGQNLNNLLGKMVGREELATAGGYINQLFNPKIKEKLIADLNPLDKISIKDESGKERFLKFNFKRVLKDNQIIRVLGNVNDITRETQLQEQLDQEIEKNSQQQQGTLQRMAVLSNIDPASLDDFISKAETTTRNINEVLKQQQPSEAYLREKVESIYREIHTLKGDASAIKLQSFVSLANRFEDKLEELRNKEFLRGEDFLPLTVMLNDMIASVSALSAIKAGSAYQAEQNLSKAMLFEKNMQEFVADLAKRNHKSASVSFSGSAALNTLPSGLSSTMRRVIIQILRNSVVHGIELPEERKNKDKLPVGHVHIDVRTQDNDVYFSVSDDGRGIDYDGILKRAQQLGLLQGRNPSEVTQNELNKIMFSSGFTTLQEATDDAGRGVGLDAIRDMVNSARGKIGIRTKADKYTRFDFKMPINDR